MRLQSGTQIGPYEIASPLGAGGMGEVYRARDGRLGRDVAIKVLPEGYAANSDWLSRFEREARAAGAINHPNIVSVHDIGTHDGSPYLVCELLEGEVLRARLNGTPLSMRKAVDYARQIAQGLAAAHGRGIVHRDLKPDNIFVTRDGHVKILDFGLAKQIGKSDSNTPVVVNEPTQPAATTPGTMMGTSGYMSPEQVTGKAADHRSDIFSFGVVLYEMVVGRRPFRGETPIEVTTAILRDEPAEPKGLPMGLDRVILHCLEKRPEDRFQAAQDLLFALDSMTGISSTTSPALVAAPRRGPPKIVVMAAGAAAACGLLAGAFFLGRGHHEVEVVAAPNRPGPPPALLKLTYERGEIHSARFATGDSFVFSRFHGARDGTTYLGKIGALAARPLVDHAAVIAISKSGDLAVARDATLRPRLADEMIGTLARVPLTGGAPRDLAGSALAADWSPDGQTLAVSRNDGTNALIEYPVGTVIVRDVATTMFGDVRISRDGTRIAYVAHPRAPDDRGQIMVVDATGGTPRPIGKPYATIMGMAWSPSGDELWFTGATGGTRRALMAITLDGRERTLLATPGNLMLQDVAADGRVLLAQTQTNRRVFVKTPASPVERDVTPYDWAMLRDLSNDGKTLVLIDESDSSSPSYHAFLRPTDGSPAVQVGDGGAFYARLSPDEKWLAIGNFDGTIEVIPTGIGQAHSLPLAPFAQRAQAIFLPDGRLIFGGRIGNEQSVQMYAQDVINGGEPTPLHVPGGLPFVFFNMTPASPDGKQILVQNGATTSLVDLADGAVRPLSFLTGADVAVQWSADGKKLYVRRGAETPAHVELVDVETGKAEPWRELVAPDVGGYSPIGTISITPNGETYAYDVVNFSSELYLVTGLN